MRATALAPIATALALLAAGPAAAADADSVIAEARALCEGFENGRFEAPPGTVTETDLTGDGVAETIVDERRYTCSSAASMYCGTGGCNIVVLAGGGAHRFLVKDWRIIDWGPDRILLTAVHGANCEGTNLRRCYEALVWSEDAFRSVRPPLE